MNTVTHQDPADRFNSLIEGLFTDVLTQIPKGWVEIPLIMLIWRRLRRMRRRIAAIVARFRAGMLPQAGTLAQAGTLPAPGSAPPRPATARPTGPRPQQPSRRLGWVIHAVSWFVMIRHYELEELLEDPEMVALVAGAPQLGRELRPLCRMLAVKLPDMLRLPRRPRRRVAKFPPAPDWLVNEPGAELRPDGTVWMRLGASTIWRPGCGQTLEETRKFDRPRRIWPRDD